MTDRFLLIGAGPLGLAVAKALGEAELPYVQAEATDHVGGNWAHGVYETAHIISSRKTTEFPDWPMPADYPNFPSAQQMCDYYNAFADAHGLRDHIRFDTRVEAVEPLSRGWRVTFADGAVEDFKGVIVCNGHHWKRIFPDWASDFTGTLLHSKDYKRPAQLQDKRVLVIGGGNSGCDIASEAARVASHAEWSLRRGYHFMPKTFFGVPSIELLKPWMPLAGQRFMSKALTRIVIGKYSDYGLPEPDHKVFEAHPTISNEIFRYLDHGKLKVRPDVSRVDGKTVHFTDGSQAEFDVIACATGYEVALPMLPEGMVEVKDHKVAQLIGGMLVPGQTHLYVFGTQQARFGIGPLVRPHAVLLAHWAKLQDEIDVPLVDVLMKLGQRPPSTHLVDPHKGMRQMRLAPLLDPLIRMRAKRMRKKRSQHPNELAAEAGR